jgi:Putative DNA-binding domain
MLDGRPLSEQGYSDLKAFLEQQVGEGLTLDYKRELTDSPRNRGELCRDVSALANSQGGTIVYGVDEQGSDRTPILPPHGTARRLSNQAVEEWAAQVLRDGVQPRIGVEMGTFGMQETPDKCLLVVRTTASPLAPHMVTLKGDNRYYGRFYRRSNYENRIAEEYEVREMMERARRLYLGIEEDLARRGYSEPSSSDFGDNPYTRRLADDRRNDEVGNRLPAEMWASIVLLPTLPASVRQAQREWLSWLDPNERKYEPSPRSIFLPHDTRRPVLNGVACLQPHRWGGAADLDEYLVLGFDGSVEFGFVPAMCDVELRGELVRYFRGVTLLYRLWWLLNLSVLEEA